MFRWSIIFLIFTASFHTQSFALTPRPADASLVVYARRNLETVVKELQSVAITAGWQCSRNESPNPGLRPELSIKCRSKDGQGYIVADDYVDPLDRLSIQGYADAQNLGATAAILRKFASRVSAIPNAKILHQKIPKSN